MQASTSTITTTITSFRARKSTPLPFLFQTNPSPNDVEKITPSTPFATTLADDTRSESVRKLTTATTLRLAQVGIANNNGNISQQSLTSTRTHHHNNNNPPRTPTLPNDNPLSPNFQALNSPGLRPPLATLGRTKSGRSTRLRSPSPSPSHGRGHTLDPSSSTTAAPASHNQPHSNLSTQRPLSFSQHRGGLANNTTTKTSTTQMRRIEIKQPPNRPSRENDRLAPLSPELRRILKQGWSPTGRGGGGGAGDDERGSVAASSIYSQPAGGNAVGGEKSNNTASGGGNGNGNGNGERRGIWM